MNKPLKKVAFSALSVLAITGVAHAKTMSLSDVSTIQVSSTQDAAINSIGTSDKKQSFVYALDLSNVAFTDNKANVSVALADTLGDGGSVNYALYNATGATKLNPSNPTGGLGRPVTSFSLVDTNDGIPPSMKLSLLDGVKYVLQVSFNGLGAISEVGAPISSVPLPGAALLFGTALLGFMGFSNRRKV